MNNKKIINQYEQRKNRARDEAIEWQHQAGARCLSMAELMEAGEYFYKLAKRYGLIKEFKENGII